MAVELKRHEASINSDQVLPKLLMIDWEQGHAPRAFQRRREAMGLSTVPVGALSLLATLAVKDGVGLGGLPAAQQTLALALVWSGLPADGVLAEGQVNDLLKAQLAGAAAFLDIDHVELRRWLVDAGWLTRDGYGREYRRVGLDALSAGQREFADALAAIEPAAWVADVRAAHRARRQARRARWQAGSGTAA
jgi:hypothetical protein